ncbi:hypothetical protein JCM5350_007157 [Sporobolomyces pararoseus]
MDHVRIRALYHTPEGYRPVTYWKKLNVENRWVKSLEKEESWAEWDRNNPEDSILPLSASTSTPPLPLDALSSHFTASLKTLVLGGPRLFSHPTLFDNLIERGDQHNFRPLSITFTQSTLEEERGRQSFGLRAADLIKALDENWASGLEVLDVEGMTDDDEEKKKYWDSIELEKLREKVEMANLKRREDGKRKMVLRYDRDSDQREREEREWEERRRNRNRGARGGRGRARR